MNTADLVTLVSSGAPRVIHTDAELERYTDILFELTGKEEPTPAEEELIELLDLLIEKYETEHFPLPDASPLDVLRLLMESHSLKQQDLVPQLGSTPLVSQILAGKRNLTVQHIRALAKRFNVPAEVFIGSEPAKQRTPQRLVSLKASSAKETKRRTLVNA